MNVALYARVSTDNQDPEVQLLALRQHCTQRGLTIVEEFIDRGVSGAKEKRPALDRLFKVAWQGQFRAVLVWRFDRFARSVKHLLSALENFRSLNIHFISLQEQFDTSSPIGQAMFTIIGAIAQLERDIIRDRVKAGLERARARGIRLGRPPTARNIYYIAFLHGEGLSIPAIAKKLGCSRSTIRRRLREAHHETTQP
ncbi:MAG: recombinase family protein [Bdellovibrionales bacterium]|nr:recombinase family protein [Bdellovibrionales bacterium]